MSYFNLSNGQAPQQTNTFEAGGADFENIPKNTVVVAVAEDAEWKSFNDDPEFISITWSIQSPAQYKNRKIFQKIKVNDAKESTRDNAIQMLAAIYTNAGKDLSQVQGRPSDTDITNAIAFKKMALKLDVWKIDKDGETKTGNFVKSVAPVTAQQAAATPSNKQIKEQMDDLPF